MILLKIEKLGDVASLTLSDEALALMNRAPGDTVAMSVDEAGNIILSVPEDVETRRERGRAFLERYRDTFEALAK